MKHIHLYLFALISVILTSCSHACQKVELQEDTVSLLRNPCMGWGVYDDANDEVQNANIYWAAQDEAARQYASFFYVRWRWSDMEPEEGKYAWLYDENYKKLIQGALDRGLKLCFRIYNNGQDNLRAGTPDYVRRAGAKGYTVKGLKGDLWTPYPDDPIFQEKLEKFVEAFAKEYDNPDIFGEKMVLADILNELTDIAFEKGIIQSDDIVTRDLFDTKLMGIMTPRPGTVKKIFDAYYEKNPKYATDYFYELSQNSNYIRKDRIQKDMKWTVDSPYGVIDITINLSKPEKDPKAIAAAKNAKQSAYPKCQLCIENEGYAGRMNHPARQNHRIIPITIHGSRWGFQYSPYVYYNEHCIVLNGQHTPMKIDRDTFAKLFDFIRQFPHYFVGSNADLPIVGGSILTHDHFQGGHYTFAMERAEMEKEFKVPGYEDVTAGIVHWPLSVIRIRHKDPERLIDLADHILKKWRNYTDPDAFIFEQTNGEPHNTITPIARRRGEEYELDLTLRNNITTEERPLGVYHPRPEYHHIKKENIGLIEVMGLAVLPSRLKKEMESLADCLVSGKDVSSVGGLEKHADWVKDFLPKYAEITQENVWDILKEEIGEVFVKVLEDAGVYKCTEEGRKAFERFINTL